MRQWRVIALVGVTLAVAACGKDKKVTEPVDPEVTTVTVAPGAVTLASIGAVAQFEATALDQSDQVMAGVTFEWASTDPSVATVDPQSGVATAVAAGTARISATAEGESGSGSLAVGVTVGQAGGVLVDEDGVVTVTIPPGAFTVDQAVTVQLTDLPETQAKYTEAEPTYEVGPRASDEIRINTGDQQPADEFSVVLAVPDQLLVALPAEFEIDMFVQIHGEGISEHDEFDLIPASFDQAAQTLTGEIPGFAFTDQRTPDGSFEAVVVLGSVPVVGGPAPASAGIALGPGGTCTTTTLTGATVTAASLPASPLTSLVVTSAFSRSRTLNGVTKPHGGVDLRAATGTPVFAANSGAVTHDTGCSACGNRAIIANTSLGTTRYTHLDAFSTGQVAVTIPRQVGKSGTTTGVPPVPGGVDPHLHFDYFPRVLTSRGTSRLVRADPWPCLNAQFGELAGRVFEDTDGDGIQDPGEAGIHAVGVTIEDVQAATHTTATDADGHWTISALPVGDAIVDVDDATLPLGATQTAGTDPSSVTIVADATTDAGTDGYQVRGSLGGRVFEDTDRSGVQDGGEPGIAGVGVTVIDALFGEHAATTDDSGDWAIHGVPVGEATVDIDDASLPEGWTQTAGTDPSIVNVVGGASTDAGSDGYGPAAEVTRVVTSFSGEPGYAVVTRTAMCSEGQVVVGGGVRLITPSTGSGRDGNLYESGSYPNATGDGWTTEVLSRNDELREFEVTALCITATAPPSRVVATFAGVIDGTLLTRTAMCGIDQSVIGGGVRLIAPSSAPGRDDDIRPSGSYPNATGNGWTGEVLTRNDGFKEFEVIALCVPDTTPLTRSAQSFSEVSTGAVLGVRTAVCSSGSVVSGGVRLITGSRDGDLQPSGSYPTPGSEGWSGVALLRNDGLREFEVIAICAGDLSS